MKSFRTLALSLVAALVMNLAASGTRHEDLLLTPTELKTITALRRRLTNMSPPMQIEQLLNALGRYGEAHMDIADLRERTKEKMRRLPRGRRS